MALYGIGFFVNMHIVLHIVISCCYPKYKEMPSKDFHEYRIQWNSFFHATIASIGAIYCVWFTCPEDKTFFNDQECREIPRNSHCYICMFTAGYLLLDTIHMCLFMGFETQIDKQMLVHHVVAFVNYYIAFWQ